MFYWMIYDTILCFIKKVRKNYNKKGMRMIEKVSLPIQALWKRKSLEWHFFKLKGEKIQIKNNKSRKLEEISKIFV